MTDLVAASISAAGKQPSAPTYIHLTTLTFADYVADGMAIDSDDLAAIVGPNNVAGIIDIMIKPVAGYFFEYVRSTGKIKAYESGADASANDEVGDGAFVQTVDAWILYV